MAQAILAVPALPEAPLDAALAFHAEHLAHARDLCRGGDLAVVFPLAGHEHRAWRLAAVQELAREAAPRRVNGIVGNDQAAIDQAATFLAASPGVTGQLLPVDGNFAQMR